MINVLGKAGYNVGFILFCAIKLDLEDKEKVTSVVDLYFLTFLIIVSYDSQNDKF